MAVRWTYRQRFGHSDLDPAQLGALQGLDGILQTSALQVGAVDVHEPVSRQQPAVLLGHAPRNKGADDDHRLGGVQRVLRRSEAQALANVWRRRLSRVLTW